MSHHFCVLLLVLITPQRAGLMRSREGSYHIIATDTWAFLQHVTFLSCLRSSPTNDCLAYCC
jgi:hypothetical protein